MLLTAMDEFSGFAEVAMALLVLPAGFVILAYLRGGPLYARLAGIGIAPGTWLDLGSDFLGRARQAALRGLRGAASGNQAFDDYRANTLRRLEDEQREFQAFLRRLSQARDKAEFDEFMAGRR